MDKMPRELDEPSQSSTSAVKDEKTFHSVQINKMTQPAPSTSAIISNFKPVDDDDQIEFILLELQTEQQRISDHLSMLQKFGQELVKLK